MSDHEGWDEFERALKEALKKADKSGREAYRNK